MEIFIFIRMGGNHEDMVVKLLDGDSNLINTLRKFDAREARCYEPTDQHILWAVIESSFGDLIPFNKLVRDIFAASAASGPSA